MAQSSCLVPGEVRAEQTCPCSWVESTSTLEMKLNSPLNSAQLNEIVLNEAELKEEFLNNCSCGVVD